LKNLKPVQWEERLQDEVIGMVAVDKDAINDSQVLVVTENGYGKRTKLVDEDGEDVYRITNRGGKGVKTLNITEKTGNLISINAVTDADDLMIINKSGLTIRMAVEDLRVMGRATQGVRLINLKGKDSIAAVTKVMKDDPEEVIVDEEGNIVEVETIERVKPVLEALEEEEGVEEEDDEDDDSDDEEAEDESDEDDGEDEA
jgi:DNA gyrase subunit A